jgi:ribosomal protein S6
MKLLTSFVLTSKNQQRANWLTGSTRFLTDNGADHRWIKGLGSLVAFAYPINKYTEGTYHVITLTTDSDEALNEFDRLSKFSDDILRHMIVKLDA